MEEYYKWQIEQLKTTVAKQDEIIRTLAGEKYESIKNKLAEIGE